MRENLRGSDFGKSAREAPETKKMELYQQNPASAVSSAALFFDVAGTAKYNAGPISVGKFR